VAYVSIVLPTYNRADWLHGAIESVLAQTFEKWELVIVDDGSTDNTRSSLRQYNDMRIRVIHRAHEGQTMTIRAGVEACLWEYVAFLSSDDELTPNALADYVAALDAGADVVYGDTWIEWRDSIFSGNAGSRSLAKAVDHNLLPARNVVWGCAFRRSVYDALGGWPVHWQIATDWGFFLSAYASGYKFVAVPSTTYTYRYHVGGQTFTQRQLQLDESADVQRKYQAGLLDVRTWAGQRFLIEHLQEG
jgi:glycosyltransferase involved in cell wall biosynthesis